MIIIFNSFIKKKSLLVTKMELMKKFDFLSPPITLYFKGEDQHHSFASAILTFICYALVLAATIYYFLGFINKDNPKAYFFTRYVEDAGNFPVNSSSMFNYIQFINKFDNSKLGFDFSVFRAVGVNSVYYEQYMNDPEVILNENHWIYGACNDNTDIKGIEHLIDPIVYKNAACIREYYNAEEKKYYQTGENGFVWPVIEKGCSNPKGTFYGIIVQRCDHAPSTLKHNGPECKSEEEISESIASLSFKYQIIDQYADMLNYTNPFTKYFYEVSSAIIDGIYIVNHLNFNPATMLTHNGIFFDNLIEEHTYFFKQNEKHTIDHTSLSEDQTTNGCLIGVYFWMQNTLQQFERNYDRFQDLLSDIGGISSIITTIGYFINLIVSGYISLFDTEELIINRAEMNFGERKNLHRRPTFIRKVSEIDNPPKRQYRVEQKNLSSTNRGQLSSLSRGKENLNIPIYLKSDEINIFNTNKRSYRNKYYKSNNYISSEKNQEISKNSDRNTSEKKYQRNEKESSVKRHNLNWFKYIRYLICCKTHDNRIRYLENVRNSLISEENIIQNYLDIYQLLKINGLPKKDLFINFNK